MKECSSLFTPSYGEKNDISRHLIKDDDILFAYSSALPSSRLACVHVWGNTCVGERGFPSSWHLAIHTVDPRSPHQHQNNKPWSPARSLWDCCSSANDSLAAQCVTSLVMFCNLSFCQRQLSAFPSMSDLLHTKTPLQPLAALWFKQLSSSFSH